MAVSLAAHLIIPLIIVTRPDPPALEPAVVEPVLVALAPPPEPPPKPETAPEGGAPATTMAAARRLAPQPRPLARVTPPAPIPPVVVPVSTAPPAAPELSEAQLAGARTAGSGSGGGSGAGTGAGAGAGCDMVDRLERALRRDPEVRAAVAKARAGAPASRAMLVWDGDWVRSGGEEGKGLAGVRQAIALEVAFAPEACRDEAMRGLVVISLQDGPGLPRLALGAGAWRWTDLLGARR